MVFNFAHCKLILKPLDYIMKTPLILLLLIALLHPNMVKASACAAQSDKTKTII